MELDIWRVIMMIVATIVFLWIIFGNKQQTILKH